MFVQSLVAPCSELEHQFIATLLTVDGMQHELLRNIPCPRDETGTRYQLAAGEYEEARLPMMTGTVDGPC